MANSTGTKSGIRKPIIETAEKRYMGALEEIRHLKIQIAEKEAIQKELNKRSSRERIRIIPIPIQDLIFGYNFTYECECGQEDMFTPDGSEFKYYRKCKFCGEEQQFHILGSGAGGWAAEQMNRLSALLTEKEEKIKALEGEIKMLKGELAIKNIAGIM